MAPKLKPTPQKPAPPKPSRLDWKTEEQRTFLVNRWESFKRAQDAKALDRFWAKLFEDWYTFWPVPSSPSLVQKYGSIEEGRLALQKEKNGQLKQWFNNRCRSGTDSAKGSRGDLKLDVNGKRKLAPVQAYCSYAWESTLRPLVLSRWEAQKKSTATASDDEDDEDEDDDDPPEDECTSEESSIPLAFKLKVAKEQYQKLTKEQKDEVDRRREEDRNKMYRKVTDIADDEERYQKLRIHERNQPLAVKALTRVLANLEDQTGCVAHLLIASVNPGGGAPQIQKFCQGSTQQGLKFETFYGDEWKASVENKFREWAVRVFGEKGTNRRDLFLLPKDLVAPSEASSQDPSTEASASQDPPALVSSQGASAGATSSQKSTSRPSRPRKPAPQLPVSEKSVPQPIVVDTPSPTPNPALQATITSDIPQSTSTPIPRLPMPHASTDPPADVQNLDTDMALFATAIGVHQPSPQAGTVPQVVRRPLTVASATPDVVEPSQLTINPSQLIIKPSEAPIELSQSISERSEVSTEIVPSQPDSYAPAATPILQSQPTATKVTNTALSQPTSKVPYRIRNPVVVPSAKLPRRGSIDGAPEIVEVITDEEEGMTVDLRDYISMESDDDVSHVSSSQKTADERQDLLSPPRDSQPPDVEETEGNTSRSALTSGRNLPQLVIDEDDLPSWMHKKSQWKYVASTAGGAEWENLLKVYMHQERRLEFTETGIVLPTEGRPPKIKEYFQYAHQPLRGDTLTVPNIGTEVVKWWEAIQPEWRRSKQDLPQSTSQWSYILSGGSKGAFLVILCLAWWDRAYGRHLEEGKARRARAKATGVTTGSEDLPAHDAQWLDIVNDVAFVMLKARDCSLPGREVSNPNRRAKRKHQEDAETPQQVAAVRRRRSKA